MPRKGRGGPRQGQPGKAYSNRSDLNAPKLPVQAAPNQTYGQAGAQKAGQQLVPMGAPPTDFTPPGQIVDLMAPTARPDEPLTAGAPLGPGPGPEVLPGFENPNEADLPLLARDLPILELMASLPTASVATRNFVRRVRGAVGSIPREG